MPDQYEVNENSMKSQQYPSEVNVLSKRVNRLSNGRQLFPVERVNFSRMDRQMLKTRVGQPYSGKDSRYVPL